MEHSPWEMSVAGISYPQASSSKDSRHKHKGRCDGKVLVAAFEEDEADSHIGKAQLAAFAVARIAAAAAAVAFSSSLQGRAAAGRTVVAFADIETELGPSLLLRCTVPTDDGLQLWAVPSSLVEHFPSGADRRTGFRSHLADASILGEADSGRLIVRGKDA